MSQIISGLYNVQIAVPSIVIMSFMRQFCGKIVMTHIFYKSFYCESRQEPLDIEAFPILGNNYFPLIIKLREPRQLL